jgi:predicted phage tail protein
MQAEYVKKDDASANALDEKTKENIKKYVEQGTGAIDERIKELDSSWDSDRVFQLNIAVLLVAGSLLLTGNKKWLLLGGVLTAFLAQNALQGSCAPVQLFRMFGMRSRKEIDREKFALKALRGDFDNIKNDIEKAWEAVKDQESKRPIGFTKNNN